MATTPTTIYGKTDCVTYYRTGTGAAPYNAIMAGDYYTSLYKFLVYLSSSGVTELVAMNTGSNGNGVGYWNEATHFGNGAFSVWKFKANSTRDWDWYFYIHNNSGSSAGSYEETAAQTPTKLMGLANFDTAAGTRSVIAQAAICISTSLSGSVNTNPWNGTISNGAATKRTPVWTTGSNPNNSLFVFPRQNYLSGSNATAKDSCLPLIRYHPNLAKAEHRWNFFCDGNGLAIAQGHIGTVTAYLRRHVIQYFGPFRLINAVTQSNPGNVLSGTGSLGFLVVRSQNADFAAIDSAGYVQDSLPEYTTIGQTANTSAVSSTLYEGGMLATLDKGIRTYQLSSDYTSGLTFPQQPNIFMGNKIVERPYSIIASGETGFQGFVGWLETPLIRAIGNGFLPGDMAQQNQRAVFGSGTTVASNRMITMPWPSSSLPPGSVFTAGDALQRDGFTFSIPNYSI